MASSKLPFRVSIRVPAKLQDYRLAIEVLGPTNLAALEPVEKVLGAFEALASAGAFASDMATPVRSRFDRVSSVIDVGLRRVYEVHGVHPGAFRVLLGALAQCHHHQTPLVHVSLEAEGQIQAEATMSAILRSPFPPRGSVPFPIDADVDLDDIKDPVLRLRFANPLSGADVQRLTAIFEGWDLLVQLGGYRDDFEPIEEFGIQQGSTYLVGPSTLEHVLYGLRYPPGLVFDPLINSAYNLSATLGGVLGLEFE